MLILVTRAAREHFERGETGSQNHFWQTPSDIVRKFVAFPGGVER